MTQSLVNKLPAFMNATSVTFTRDVIFGDIKACQLLVKKLYGNTHHSVFIRGYSADNVYKTKYKRDVTDKFITVYNFEKGKCISAVAL